MLSAFVSLHPHAPWRVDVYDRVAQTMLGAARPGDVVQLGPERFGASVHLAPDGAHHQTTPSFATKSAGWRSVKDVVAANDCAEIDVFLTAHGSYSLHASPRAKWSHRLSVDLRLQPHDIVWEWSMELDLRAARQEDWICYDDAHQSALEANWSSQGSVCHALSIGIRQYTVRLEQNATFGTQTDIAHNKVRYVRRCLRRRDVLNVRKNEMRRLVALQGDGMCAICHEDFAETPSLPIFTLPCKHAFHAACAQPVSDRTRRCPMCRAAY